MSDSRYFLADDRGDVLVLRLQAVSLDRAAANEFGADLLAISEKYPAGRFVINLADATQISSPALAKLIAFDKRLATSGGKMLICEAPAAVNQIILLAWPGRSTDLAVSEDAAVAEITAWEPTVCD